MFKCSVTFLHYVQHYSLFINLFSPSEEKLTPSDGQRLSLSSRFSHWGFCIQLLDCGIYCPCWCRQLKPFHSSRMVRQHTFPLVFSKQQKYLLRWFQQQTFSIFSASECNLDSSVFSTHQTMPLCFIYLFDQTRGHFNSCRSVYIKPCGYSVHA